MEDGWAKWLEEDTGLPEAVPVGTEVVEWTPSPTLLPGQYMMQVRSDHDRYNAAYTRHPFVILAPRSFIVAFKPPSSVAANSSFDALAEAVVSNPSKVSSLSG
jgi:hypothetical protein